MRLVFRFLLLGLGVWLAWMGAMDTYTPIHNRLFGVTVEGEVTGFLAGRHTPSVQLENTAHRNGKRIARRPVFSYPTAQGGSQRLTGKAKTAFVASWTPYELGEKVTVVFPQGHPEQAYLFATSTIFGGMLTLAFGLLCVYIGLGGRL